MNHDEALDIVIAAAMRYARLGEDEGYGDSTEIAEIDEAADVLRDPIPHIAHRATITTTARCGWYGCDLLQGHDGQHQWFPRAADAHEHEGRR